MRLFVAFAALVPLTMQAQGAPPLVPQLEFKTEIIAERNGVVSSSGVGLMIPAGSYVRIDAVPSAGAFFGRGTSDLTASVDAVARFLLDPFRQQSWGLSLGAGIEARAQQHAAGRSVLIVVADLEGSRNARGFSPAIQLGVGGGVRLGFVFRRSDMRAMIR